MGAALPPIALCMRSTWRPGCASRRLSPREAPRVIRAPPHAGARAPRRCASSPFSARRALAVFRRDPKEPGDPAPAGAADRHHVSSSTWTRISSHRKGQPGRRASDAVPGGHHRAACSGRSTRRASSPRRSPSTNANAWSISRSVPMSSARWFVSALVLSLPGCGLSLLYLFHDRLAK